LKIVYFSYLYDIDGISLGAKIKAVELLSELENLGHEVKIYWMNRQPAETASLGTQTRQAFKARFAKVLHEPNQILMSLKYLIKEWKIVKKEDPDIIISRLDVYKFSSVIISKLKKIPLIIELDNPVVYEFRTFQPNYRSSLTLLRFLEKLNLRHSKISFTVSNEIRNHYLEQGIAPEKIQVISNGVNLNKFHPSIDATEVIQKYKLEDTIVIGFVGTFHYWHGVDNLVTLFKKITSLNSKVRFLMVGSGGPMKERLQEVIELEKLQKRAILTGFVSHDKIPQHIAAMDIVLAPYPELDFFYYSPLKVFEYMACGKPVITTRIGQNQELIANGESGYLCDPGNLDEMIEKILNLISNPELRARMGQEARRSIEENHSWRVKAQNLCTLFSDTPKITEQNGAKEFEVVDPNYQEFS